MNIRTTLVLATIALVLASTFAGARPSAAYGNTPGPLAQQSTAVPPAPSTRAPAPGPSARGMVGPIIGVVLVFMASAVGFGFALGLRRRINAIAGPDPDAEEDEL